MPQLVASWLKTLKPVESGGVRAFLNDGWELLRAWPMPESWSEDDARLVLTLFRPDPETVQEFASQYCVDMEDAQGVDHVTHRCLRSLERKIFHVSSYARLAGRCRKHRDCIRPRGNRSGDSRKW